MGGHSVSGRGEQRQGLVATKGTRLVETAKALKMVVSENAFLDPSPSQIGAKIGKSSNIPLR